MANILALGTSALMSHIVLHLLGDNNEITVLDRKPPNLLFDNPELERYTTSSRIKKIQLSQSDFTSRIDKIENLKSYDAVIYGLTIHDSIFSNDNPIETVTTNTVFTTQVMDKLRQANFNGSLYFLSTARVYGFKSKDNEIKPISEDIPCNPVGVKAVTRYAQENIITGLCKTYGIKYMVLRLGTPAGAFTPLEGMLNQWMLSALNKTHYYVPVKGVDSKESRDWINVFDIGEFFREVIKNRKKGMNEIYNLGGGHRREQFIQNVSESIKKVFRGYNDIGRTNYTGYFDERVEKDLRIWLDLTKIKTKLEYKPMVGFDSEKMYRDIALFLGHKVLSFGNKEMMDLERHLGVFNEQRKQYMIETGELDEQGMSKEVKDTVGRIREQIG